MARPLVILGHVFGLVEGAVPLRTWAWLSLALGRFLFAFYSNLNEYAEAPVCGIWLCGPDRERP